MSYRKPLIGLIIFLVVSLTLTWTVFNTLQRSVNGSTKSYSAVFTDVSVSGSVTMSGWPASASVAWIPSRSKEPSPE